MVEKFQQKSTCSDLNKCFFNYLLPFGFGLGGAGGVGGAGGGGVVLPTGPFELVTGAGGGVGVGVVPEGLVVGAGGGASCPTPFLFPWGAGAF
jgi:hypothetical protein